MEIIVYRYLLVLPIVGLCQFLNEQFVFLRCGLVSGKEIENNLHLDHWILGAWLYQTEVREILPSLVVEILHGAVCYHFVSWKLKQVFIISKSLPRPTRIRLRVR